ncbi:hypothetical protein SteCoe_26071 [Stentor coeruleus]|uniref:Helicase ATP-binding domain-containing protein n=1 Tax=Stentor coeruleus TaxID=5963 RepID=A0A1R2BDV1_9CILI|nr:hypothetical protein SteCoe_26071 [Stentor coeruleus]
MFDSIYNDPQTLKDPVYSEPLKFWRDYSFLPIPVIENIEICCSSSLTTSVQEKVLSSFTNDIRLYNFISPHGTGLTTVMVALSAVLVENCNSNTKIKVLWLTESSYLIQNIGNFFRRFAPQLRVSSEITENYIDVQIISCDRDIYRKRIDSIFNAPNVEFKGIIFDGAEDIFSKKDSRMWLGGLIGNANVRYKTGTPFLIFTQAHTSTPVETFISELSIALRENSKPNRGINYVNSDMNILQIVPHYFLSQEKGSNWLRKILGNSTKLAKKGILIFDYENDYPLYKGKEIGLATNEDEISILLQSMARGECKVIRVRKRIEPRIRTYQIGLVIHVGLPMLDNTLDSQEYRNRVNRLYSPNFIGFSLIVCQDFEIYKVRQLSMCLDIQIMAFEI